MKHVFRVFLLFPVNGLTTFYHCSDDMLVCSTNWRLINGNKQVGLSGKNDPFWECGK